MMKASMSVLSPEIGWTSAAGSRITRPATLADQGGEAAPGRGTGGNDYTRHPGKNNRNEPGADRQAIGELANATQQITVRGGFVWEKG